MRDLELHRSFDHLVYVRLFEGCNLHCQHCFIPSNPKRMSLDLVAQIPELLAPKVAEGSKVLIQWHGGEPTLMGPGFIQQAIETLLKDARYQWSFGIQTNLLNYNPQWADLYHRYFQGEVGVSWDPLIREMKSGDVKTRNARFEAVFWPHLNQLIEDGLNPYLVITATKTLFETFTDPMVLYQRLADAGVKHLHFERVTKTGYARTSWDSIGLSNQEYSRWMSRWYQCYRLWNQQYPHSLSISPFDGLEHKVHELNQGKATGGYGCWSGACDTRFHTIDSHGYKSGCTAVTSEEDNQNASSVQPILWVSSKQSFSSQRLERTADCQSCAFRSICNTGCLTVSRMDESGECSGGYELYQTIQRSLVSRH